MATHRFKMPADLDATKLKTLARTQWSLFGANRLVKICPNTAHDPNLDLDLQYPHAYGVPQWVVRKDSAMPAWVTALVVGYPVGVYQAADLVRT